jgi:hemolysin activation/secretion protein
MKLISMLFFVLTSFLYGNIARNIDLQNNLLNQKKVYKKLQNIKNQKIPYYKTKKQKSSSLKKEAKCFYIKKIKIEGVTLLGEDERSKILKNYTNHCDTLQDIKNLINKFNSFYIDKGYITSKVYLKPQNLSKGVLRLFALEGKIESIKPDKLYIKDVFLGQSGDVLDLRKIEDAIELINRLPSNHATLDIKPSKKVGYSSIIIKNKTTKRVSGSFEVNNFGAKKTGRLQGSLALNLDNLLGINDQLGIVLNGTDKEFSDENSKGNSLSFSFPLGRILNDFSYSKTSYQQLEPASITNYKLNGDTKTFRYNLSYKLYHNQTNSIKVGTSISHSKNRNFIESTLIQTSSYSLSNVGFNVNFLHNTNSFYAYVLFDYEKGTKWFGTNNPTELNPRFALYSVDLSLRKNFSFFNYSLQAHYQHTKDKLFSNFRISIGGAYSVRGYEDEGLSGNNGYYFRNEFSKPLQSKLFGLLHQSYFIALDGGHIKKQSDSNGGDLLAYAIGGRFSNDKFDAMIYYAKPIYKDIVSSTRSFVGFTLGYRF